MTEGTSCTFGIDRLERALELEDDALLAGNSCGV
jgi:hypothetical protein